MLSEIKMIAIAAILGALVSSFLWWGHSEYDKGYNAAIQKQNDAIVAYQGIVVKKDQEKAEELAKLSTAHATELANLQASIPQAQEKIRVITKTIDRPAVCTLVPDELSAINQAINSANGSSSATH